MRESTKSNVLLISFKTNNYGNPQHGYKCKYPKIFLHLLTTDSSPVRGIVTSNIIAGAGSTTSDGVENG